VEISISIKSTFMCLTCFMPQRQQQRHHHHHSANEIVSILFMHLTSPEKENCRNWLIKYLFIRKCLACFSLRTFWGYPTYLWTVAFLRCSFFLYLFEAFPRVVSLIQLTWNPFWAYLSCLLERLVALLKLKTTYKVKSFLI